MADSVSVAIVGLGFGAAWVPWYQGHPNVARVAICDTNSELLASVAAKYGVKNYYSSLQELLVSDDYDAVHLATPIPAHAEQAVSVLRSGRHCACAIPMAVTLAGIQDVLEEQRRSGKRYMLMETENYSRTFLYAKRLFESGAMGALQFATGYHHQIMEGWPQYWRGLPPMYYSGHGLGPILEIAAHPIEWVTGTGSGTLDEPLRGVYGESFPVESAFMHLRDSDVTLQVTCSLYKMVRAFVVDRFSFYGDVLGFESAQIAGNSPVLFRCEQGLLSPGLRGRQVTAETVEVPPLSDLVAPQIAEFVRTSRTFRGIPLVHEFVRSIIEDREPGLSIRFAANMTAAGICAHDSATRKGEPVAVPQF